MEFPSLSLKNFQKISKNKMRVPNAVKIHSGSMLTCIEKYGHRISDKIPTEQFSALKVHIEKSNRQTDDMINT